MVPLSTQSPYQRMTDLTTYEEIEDDFVCIKHTPESEGGYTATDSNEVIDNHFNTTQRAKTDVFKAFKEALENDQIDRIEATLNSDTIWQAPDCQEKLNQYLLESINKKKFPLFAALVQSKLEIEASIIDQLVDAYSKMNDGFDDYLSFLIFQQKLSCDVCERIFYLSIEEKRAGIVGSAAFSHIARSANNGKKASLAEGVEKNIKKLQNASTLGVILYEIKFSQEQQRAINTALFEPLSLIENGKRATSYYYPWQRDLLIVLNKAECDWEFDPSMSIYLLNDFVSLRRVNQLSSDDYKKVLQTIRDSKLAFYENHIAKTIKSAKSISTQEDLQFLKSMKTVPNPHKVGEKWADLTKNGCTIS